MNALRSMALVVGALALGGCSAQAGYVAADRETYEAVWPLFWAYTEADESLSDLQRDIRAEKGKSWEARIKRGEEVGKE